MGCRSPLSSLLWGCIAIFAITNQPTKGAISAGLAAILAFFGIIHQAHPVIGGDSPTIFLISYIMIAGLFILKYLLDRREQPIAN
ncbi:hypothetical protein [Avibacterium paragallinarum]|uniref:hypothetical protein n=1 Tax=Avibacterium paragallinarum TaxID=728 RepID=UPI0011C04187|nr:hypothetical protein [Avibacterium paragallinarum]